MAEEFWEEEQIFTWLMGAADVRRGRFFSGGFNLEVRTEEKCLLLLG